MVVAVLGLFLGRNLAQAGVVPISVFPDPVQFPAVAENSTTSLQVYLTNPTADSVVVTSVTITGTNAANFAINGPTCAGTIPAGQTCQLDLTFTPSTPGAFIANLQIAVQGLKNRISVPLAGTGGNPTPVINSLSPASAYVNSPGVTLTVNGASFIAGATVYLENTALTTTYVSGTTLTAQIPASLLTETGSDFLQVVNPGPGGGYSELWYFSVVALDPSVSIVSPSSLTAGTTPASLVVNGNNFMSGATVQWNGARLPTTYLGSNQLQVTPTATELANAGIVQLSVANPAPGGTSAPIAFNVTYPAKVTVLNLPANDLVWDPYAQRIYASLPSSYGPQGNSIAVINPAEGHVNGYYNAGSEPNQLALSSDSQFLYVGLNGNGSIQRFILPNFSKDINVSLGIGEEGGVNTALSLQVSPGDSHTFAAAIGSNSCCGNAGLYFYTDTTQLPDSITYPDIDQVIFPSATTLYGYYNGTVSQVAVTSSGGTLETQWNGLVEGNTFQYASGVIYGSSGEALDTATGLLLGTYDVSTSCCGNSGSQLLPDAPINRVFVFGDTPFFNGLGITSYNLAKFTPVAVTNLSQLSGGTTSTFLRWGSNGLALILGPGCCGGVPNQVILVQSPAMLLNSGTKSPAPVAQSLAPSSATHGGSNFPVTVTGTGFTPGSQVSWNGNGLYADYVSPTELTVYVPASAVASAGAAQIVITNPTPGGGTSSALTFTIN